MRRAYDTKKGFGAALMLMIAYGASIGGVGTPVGTPPNVHLYRGIHQAVSLKRRPLCLYSGCCSAFPQSSFLVLITWGYLSFVIFRYPTTGWQAKPSILQSRLTALGPMSQEEKKVLLVSVLTALLWIFRENLLLGSVTIPGWSRFAASASDGSKIRPSP